MYLVVLAMTFGCRSADPFAGAPAPSEDQTHHVYAIEVSGEISGFEDRWVGRGRIVRRRTWSVRLGGEDRILRAASVLEHDGHGPVRRYARWRPEAQWSGAAWMPDALPPPTTGSWPLLDPWTLEVHPTEVSITGDRVVWEGSGGRAEARYDAEGLRFAEQGAIRMVRRAEAPGALTPFDPAALWAVPTPPQPRARRSLVGRFTVDGDAVRIDAPIWAQVPAVALPGGRSPPRPRGPGGAGAHRSARGGPPPGALRRRSPRRTTLPRIHGGGGRPALRPRGLRRGRRRLRGSGHRGGPRRRAGGGPGVRRRSGGARDVPPRLGESCGSGGSRWRWIRASDRPPPTRRTCPWGRGPPRPLRGCPRGWPWSWWSCVDVEVRHQRRSALGAALWSVDGGRC